MAKTKVEKAPKVEKYKIFMDETGKVELRREVLKQGRAPKNSTKDANGNRIVIVTGDEVSTIKPNALNIVLNADGSEKSRTPKGRGRPGKGFVKTTDGQYAGNWVKTETAEAATPAEVVEAPAVVADVAPIVEAAAPTVTETTPTA